MTKQKTLWRNAEAKWKPRNLQAAKICFPAKGLHLPPEEIKEPVFAVSLKDQLEAESKARRERIADNLEKYGPMPEPLKKKSPHPHRPKKVKGNWQAKQQKRLAKMIEKARVAERAAGVALKPCEQSGAGSASDAALRLAESGVQKHKEREAKP